MKIGKNETTKIKVDEHTVVKEYVTSELSDRVSLAFISIEGKHTANPNVRSDKILFAISGEATIEFEGKKQKLEAMDSFFVPRNKGFRVHGNITYISVASPPFDPKDEIPQ